MLCDVFLLQFFSVRGTKTFFTFGRENSPVQHLVKVGCLVDEDAYLVCITIRGDVMRGSRGHHVRWANLLEQQLVITIPPELRAI